MTTLTIPSSLIVLAYTVLALELWQMRQTVFQIGMHTLIFGGRIVLIAAKRTYRLVKKSRRRIRRYASRQAKIFAYHYPHVANGTGNHKSRRGLRPVPGLWFDRALFGGTLLVVGIAQFI